MDQLKTFLAALQKYHFWILCVLAAIVGLVIVVVSGKKLIGVYDSKKAEISSTDNRIREVSGRTEHPNENWIKAVEKKTTEYKKKAYDGWVRLWKQQKKNVFVWPDIGKEFIAYYNFQMDDKAKPTLAREKMQELSGYYQTYVTMTILPKMAKLIDAEWNGDKNANAGAGVRSVRGIVQSQPQAPGDEHPVVWDPTDQERLFQMYAWDELPTEAEIRCAQEDMWVLQALFEAIARANNGARVSTDTVVRTVQEVSYGKDTCTQMPLGENAGRVIRLGPSSNLAAAGEGPGASNPAGAGPGAFGAPSRGRLRGRHDQSPGGARRAGVGRFAPAPVTSAPTPGPDAAPDAGPAGPPDALRDGRYADTKGKCLPWSQVQASTTPEYRLMPFRLLLECDESRFQVIIAELSNSVLPLEVREVRINQETDNANQGGRRDRKGRQAAPVGGGGVASVMHNATVEIFGLAYLVNPPDLDKLKVNDSATGDATATAANGATTPGANTGAATTATSGTAAAATATTTTAAAPAASGSGQTTPAAGTSTTTTGSDTTTTVPAKAPDATAPSPMATGANNTGNGVPSTATTPTTGTPAGNTPAK
jgi:hypothetical protein